jgi:hypothetical protein
MFSIDQHLEHHAALKNMSGAWPPDVQGDLFRTQTNVLWHVPGVAEIAGTRYQSIANCKTYAASQTPSASNKFTIITGGSSENFDMDSWVYIELLPGARLTGQITSNVAFSSSFFESVIVGGEVTNYIGTSANFVNFLGTTFSGGTMASGAWIIANNFCAVNGGDFSAAAVASFAMSFINAGTFGSVAQFQECIFPVTASITFNGGKISGGYCEHNITNTSGSLVINGMNFPGAGGATLTASSGASIYTISCTGNYTLTGAGSTFDYKLTTPNLKFKEESSTAFSVRNSSDDQYRDLKVRDILAAAGTLTNLSAYATNALALGGGLSVGDLYRTGGDPDTVCVVH